jgi:cytochrome c
MERDMFDTMTMTKTLGAFCGALLVFMLGGWAAQVIYVGGEGGHGEHEQAYTIPVEDAGGEAAPVEEGPPFEELFAAADPAAGEGKFRACQSCHSLAEGENKTGPSLHGVVGRPIDAVEGFAYSGALLQVGEVWTPEALNHFLTDTKAAAPGTKMTYAGMSSATDRANLIAYLATNPG